MRMTSYEIEKRAKADPLSIASHNDFQRKLSNKRVDIEYILTNPSITPYCIDAVSGDILLVEVRESADIFSSPFLYEAQYANALRLHAISMNDLLAATEGLPSPDNVLFLHSTGRCGSTLLANALRATGGVTVFSEPDIFTQLASLGRREDGAEAQVFRRLYVSLVKFFARSGEGTAVFKFRAAVSEHADHLAAALPQARNIFVHRGAVDVARSYARVTGRSLGSWVLSDTEREAWSLLVPLLRRRPEPIDGYELMAALWAGPTLRYLENRAEGFWAGALDYADLIADPSAKIDAVRGLMGLAPTLPALWDSIFSKHSQEGSHLAPDRLTALTVLEEELASSEFPAQIDRKLQAIDKRLSVGMLLPSVEGAADSGSRVRLPTI